MNLFIKSVHKKRWLTPTIIGLAEPKGLLCPFATLMSWRVTKQPVPSNVILSLSKYCRGMAICYIVVLIMRLLRHSCLIPCNDKKLHCRIECLELVERCIEM